MLLKYKLRSALIILLSFTFLLSCNKFVKNVNSKNNSCPEIYFLNEIKSNWNYKENLFYLTSDSFINHLNTKFHSCIYMSDTTTIFNYFGKHYKTGQVKNNDSLASYLQYPISLKPVNKNPSYLYFYLDINYKIREIGYLEAIEIFQK